MRRTNRIPRSFYANHEHNSLPLSGLTTHSLVIFLLSVVFAYQKYFVYQFGIKFLNVMDDAIIILGVFVFIAARKDLKFRVPIFFRLLVVFGVYLFLNAVINGVDIDVAAVQFRSYALFSLVVLLISNMSIEVNQVYKAISKVVLIFIPILLFAVIELVLMRPLMPLPVDFASDFVLQVQGYRIVSLLGNPIDFGNLLGFIGIFYIHRVFCFGSRKKDIFFLLLALLLLLATGSRGPLLGLMVAIVLVAPLKKSILVLIVLITFGVMFGQSLIYKIGTDLNQANLEHNWRYIWLLDSARVFADHPFLGVGPGRFGGWVSVNYQYSEIYTEYDISTFGIATIDMFWPHLLVEMGLFGLFLFVLPWFLAFVHFNKSAPQRKLDLPLHNFFKRVGKSSIVFVVVISFFSSSYEIQFVQFLFFAFISFSAVGLRNIGSKSKIAF